VSDAQKNEESTWPTSEWKPDEDESPEW
jgi:hypothetical protein